MHVHVRRRLFTAAISGLRVFLSIAEYCACERYRCNSAGVLTPARTLLGVAATLTLLLLLMCLL